MTAEKREAAEDLLADMLKEGVIEPSKAGNCLPLLVVRKPEITTGKKRWRMVIDYREVNAATIKDAHPLPNVAELFDAVTNKEVFSVVDVKNGFHNLKLTKESKPLTTFTDGKRLYQYTRMPMGWANGPAEFVRAMEFVLDEAHKKGRCKNTKVFLDDCLTGGSTIQECFKETNELIEELNLHGLPINPDKCYFGMKRVKFLGYQIEKDGRSIPTQAMEKIKRHLHDALLYPVKTDLDEKRIIQRILGTIGYFRKWIPHYSDRVKFLTAKLRNDCEERRKLSQDDLAKIEDLITDLGQSGLIQSATNGGETLVYLDASDQDAAYVAIQNGKIVDMDSRGFQSDKVKDCATDRELAAILLAIEKLKFRVDLRKATFFTDHRALIDMMKAKEQKYDRRARAIRTIDETQVTLKYIKGTENVIADALSRCGFLARKKIKDGATNATRHINYTNKTWVPGMGLLMMTMMCLISTIQGSTLRLGSLMPRDLKGPAALCTIWSNETSPGFSRLRIDDLTVEVPHQRKRTLLLPALVRIQQQGIKYVCYEPKLTTNLDRVKTTKTMADLQKGRKTHWSIHVKQDVPTTRTLTIQAQTPQGHMYITYNIPALSTYHRQVYVDEMFIYPFLPLTATLSTPAENMTIELRHEWMVTQNIFSSFMGGTLLEQSNANIRIRPGLQVDPHSFVSTNHLELSDSLYQCDTVPAERQMIRLPHQRRATIYEGKTTVLKRPGWTIIRYGPTGNMIPTNPTDLPQLMTHAQSFQQNGRNYVDVFQVPKVGPTKTDTILTNIRITQRDTTKILVLEERIDYPWNQDLAARFGGKWEVKPTDISQEVESRMAYHPYTSTPELPHSFTGNQFKPGQLNTCCANLKHAARLDCCGKRTLQLIRKWFDSVQYLYTKKGIALVWFQTPNPTQRFLTEVGNFVVQITEDVVEYHNTREPITIYRANDLVVTINGRVIVLAGGKSEKAILSDNKNKTTTTTRTLPPTLQQLGLNGSYDLLRSLTFIPASLQIFEKIQLNHRLKVHQQGKRIEEGRLEVTTHNQKITYNCSKTKDFLVFPHRQISYRTFDFTPIIMKKDLQQPLLWTTQSREGTKRFIRNQLKSMRYQLEHRTNSTQWERYANQTNQVIQTWSSIKNRGLTLAEDQSHAIILYLGLTSGALTVRWNKKVVKKLDQNNNLIEGFQAANPPLVSDWVWKGLLYMYTPTGLTSTPIEKVTQLQTYTVRTYHKERVQTDRRFREYIPINDDLLRQENRFEIINRGLERLSNRITEVDGRLSLKIRQQQMQIDDNTFRITKVEADVVKIKKEIKSTFGHGSFGKFMSDLGQGIEQVTNGVSHEADKLFDHAESMVKTIGHAAEGVIDHGGEALGKLTTPIAIAGGCVGGAVLIMGLIMQYNKNKDQNRHRELTRPYVPRQNLRRSEDGEEVSLRDPRIFISRKYRTLTWIKLMIKKNPATGVGITLTIVWIIAGITIFTLTETGNIRMAKTLHGNLTLILTWVAVVVLGSIVSWQTYRYPRVKKCVETDCNESEVEHILMIHKEPTKVHITWIEVPILGILLIGPILIELLDMSNTWTPLGDEKDKGWYKYAGPAGTICGIAWILLRRIQIPKKTQEICVVAEDVPLITFREAVKQEMSIQEAKELQRKLGREKFRKRIYKLNKKRNQRQRKIQHARQGKRDSEEHKRTLQIRRKREWKPSYSPSENQRRRIEAEKARAAPHNFDAALQKKAERWVAEQPPPYPGRLYPRLDEQC